jgi:hypothetical protein
MVLGIDDSKLPDRIAMWRWDIRQQFGPIGVIAALGGAIRLWWVSKRWALCVWSAYAISTFFALTYNVGDTHVFFLPGHFIAALAIAAIVAPSRRAGARLLPAVASVVLLLHVGWRAWETYPAADRHLDRRPDLLVARLLSGLDERSGILLSRMNWEPENALLYSTRYERTGPAWKRLPDVLPHLPYLVRDNHAIGRDVILTTEAAADVAMSFGSLFPLVRDEPTPPSLFETVAEIPEGLPYVLVSLQPLSEEAFSADDLQSVLKMLGTDSQDAPRARYQVWAGLTGSKPAFHQASDRPFRTRFSILGDEFVARMDSWLPDDTFRRGGFGHVLRGRQRVLFVERGLSLVWFRPNGSAAAVYAAGVYAPRPRFRIPHSAALFAAR